MDHPNENITGKAETQLSSDSANVGEYTRLLAHELLADIELARTGGAQLILKAARLARLVGNSEMMEWLRFEMHGYRRGEAAERYMDWTGRWTDKAEGKGYWGGLGEIEGRIGSLTAKLQTLRLPDISSDMAAIALREIRLDAGATSGAIAVLEAVRSKVLALLHRYVTDIHYELNFSGRQETMFEEAQVSHRLPASAP